MKPALFVSLVCLALLGSCATYSLAPLARDGITVKTDRTRSWAVVKKDGLSVEVSAILGYEVQFEVRVVNGTDKTITLDSNQFQLYAGDPQSWSLTSLISADEYYNRAAAEERRRMVVTTYNSAPVYSQRTTTTTIGGSGSSVTIVRTQPVPQIEPQVVTIVTPANQQRLEQLRARLFATVTLEPGKSYQGLVFADPMPSAYYRLVVPANGTNFEAVFQRTKDRGPFTNLN